MSVFVSKQSQQRFNRELDARQSCINQVNSIFYGAIRDMDTFEEILNRLGRVYDSKAYKRLTIAWKEYVRGYIDCHFNDLYRSHLAWGFKPLGVFCATFEQVQRDYHDEIVKDACNGFHYWKESNGERPYYQPQGQTR